MHLLLAAKISEEMVRRAEVVLNDFYYEAQDIYGFYTDLYPCRRELCGLNVHNLCHLPDQVRNWGPLWTHSCFNFEDLNGWIKTFCHGTGDVCHQIVRGMSTWQANVRDCVADSCDDTASNAFIQDMMTSLPYSKLHTRLLQSRTKNCNIFPPCKPAILSSNLYDAVKELDSNCGELEEVSRILHNGEVFYAVTSERHIKREPFVVLLRSSSVAIIKKFLYSRQTNRVYVVVDDFQKMMSLFRDRLPMLTKIKKNSQANERSYIVRTEDVIEKVIYTNTIPTETYAYITQQPNHFEKLLTACCVHADG
ncbi:uncharacterized protein LOC134178049 [Corticium candelabrum]|uniref:uncharacterized protein LOC134178049 n=1 Tax=Corticium candelabrum TaxID=121492 RepID=UPI002E258EE7|nr:uncharacterized protein LOC134178049 [Corticium candelabrum]